MHHWFTEGDDLVRGLEVTGDSTKNSKRIHAKHEKCNETIEHTNVASEARRKTIGGGANELSVAGVAAARPVQGSTLDAKSVSINCHRQRLHLTDHCVDPHCSSAASSNTYSC